MSMMPAATITSSSNLLQHIPRAVLPHTAFWQGEFSCRAQTRVPGSHSPLALSCRKACQCWPRGKVEHIPSRIHSVSAKVCSKMHPQYSRRISRESLQLIETKDSNLAPDFLADAPVTTHKKPLTLVHQPPISKMYQNVMSMWKSDEMCRMHIVQIPITGSWQQMSPTTSPTSAVPIPSSILAIT